jgi:hypothetical protein
VELANRPEGGAVVRLRLRAAPAPHAADTARGGDPAGTLSTAAAARGGSPAQVDERR